MNILFLCTSNLNRSKTAEDLFKIIDHDNSYRSAGLNARYCSFYGSKLCTTELLDWANIIYTMEEKHIIRIGEYTEDKYLNKIVNLEIEDIYTYMQPELVELIIFKVKSANNIVL